MTVDQCINVLVTLTLLEMMVALGLGVTVGELAGVARDWRLLIRAALANYVCVPAATVVLLLLFAAQPTVCAGFLILAVCPGAPFGPPCVALARGSMPVAVGLMVMLAGSSAVVAPLLLGLLLPITAGDQTLSIDATRLVVTLLLTQFLPLGVGLAIRAGLPGVANRLLAPAQLVSKVLSVLVVVVIVVAQFHLLTEIRPRAYAGMLSLLAATLAAGWLLGGSRSDERKAMTLTTALRNIAVGLVIATGAFPGTPAVTAILAYGVVELTGALLLAALWGRQPTAPESGAPIHGAIPSQDALDKDRRPVTDAVEELAMEMSTKRIVSLFVIRSAQHWVVRDEEGNFWLVPSGDNGWDQRRPFFPDEETELEPVPGHYKAMLGLPF